MAGLPGLKPVLAAWALHYPFDPAQVADSKLFADTLAGTDTGLMQALSDALTPRVAGGAQWPLQFVIHLARRGRIKVNARYERRAWWISLMAGNCATHHWLASQQQAVQRRLTRMLGQPVSVRLQLEWQ